jgi:hypothetical protein
VIQGRSGNDVEILGSPDVKWNKAAGQGNRMQIATANGAD